MDLDPSVVVVPIKVLCLGDFLLSEAQQTALTGSSMHESKDVTVFNEFCYQLER